MKTIHIDDGTILIGTAKEIAKEMKDYAYEEMLKCAEDLGYSFTEDGDFEMYLDLAGKFDHYFLEQCDGAPKMLYILKLFVCARYEIESYPVDSMY